MKQINLLQALAAKPNELANRVLPFDKQTLHLRPSHDEWSTAEVLTHLIDVEPKFMVRLKRIVAEERPFLPYFGPNEAVYDVTADKETLLATFAQVRTETISYLKTLPPPEWQRTAVHETFGETNLLFHVQNIVSHDKEHTNQILEIQTSLQSLGKSHFDFEETIRARVHYHE